MTTDRIFYDFINLRRQIYATHGLVKFNLHDFQKIIGWGEDPWWYLQILKDTNVIDWELHHISPIITTPLPMHQFWLSISDEAIPST